MLLNKFYLLFSIELVPCLDASGPTLAVNVLHEPGYKLLLSMLRKEVASPLPRLDALAMEDTGIIYCEYLFNLYMFMLPPFIVFFIKFTFIFQL